MRHEELMDTNEAKIFYDALAEDYDKMTRFEQRLENEALMLKKWVEKYNIRSALDAACGTGLHAILLSRWGIETVGCDISPAMLEKARKNAKKFEANVKWIESDMQSLGEKFQDRVDAIFCLGNSLPHLLSENELHKTLKSFYSILIPEGILVIQILNYQKILKNRQRIVGIRWQGEKEFIRFYDFLEKTVRFNVLTIQWQGMNVQHHLQSTELFPYQTKNLLPMMVKTRFNTIKYYGDMSFNKFDPDRSNNLVMVGHKSKV